MSNAIYSAALKVTVGSPTRKAVLLVLADMAGADAIAWPSVKLIANHTELGQSTVREAIAKLERDGFITVHSRYEAGRQRANIYTVNVEALETPQVSLESYQPPVAGGGSPSSSRRGMPSSSRRGRTTTRTTTTEPTPTDELRPSGKLLRAEDAEQAETPSVEEVYVGPAGRAPMDDERLAKKARKSTDAKRESKIAQMKRSGEKSDSAYGIACRLWAGMHASGRPDPVNVQAVARTVKRWIAEDGLAIATARKMVDAFVANPSAYADGNAPAWQHFLRARELLLQTAQRTPDEPWVNPYSLMEG